MYMWHGSGWGAAWMMLAMVGFWAVVVVSVVLVLRAAPWRAPRHSATDILAERLARGEIDAEEYASRLEALRRSAAA